MNILHLKYVISIAENGSINKAAEELQKAMSVGVAANLGNVVNQASNFRTIELACMVLAALPLAGLLICGIAAFGATQRYIRITYDELYR